MLKARSMRKGMAGILLAAAMCACVSCAGERLGVKMPDGSSDSSVEAADEFPDSSAGAADEFSDSPAGAADELPDSPAGTSEAWPGANGAERSDPSLARGTDGKGEPGRFVPEKEQMRTRLSQMLDGEVPCVLPSSYDYRQVGRAPRIRNQGTYGTCWAFASLTALESALLPDESLRFSVDHMTLNNGFCLTGVDGGEYTMSMAYLLSWRGPVLEADDPYGDGVSPDGLSPVKHVQEIRILPEKDYEKIKRAVYLYGGVQSSLYTSLTSADSHSEDYNEQYDAYCYIGTERPNHDSVIIGWDDHFPGEYFRAPVEGDGAFICATSWGEEFGDDGYFYVSYYDTNIGVQNLLYTSVADADQERHIYQSDLRGWVGQLGYGEETAYAANVYESAGDEALYATGFYATDADTEYQVYVARQVSGAADLTDRVCMASGRFQDAGYYTVPFSRPVDVEAGERFAVVVKLTTPGAVHPVAVEFEPGDGRTSVDISDGEGYLSLDGKSWRRVEDAQSCNICLKAYTADR